MTVAELEERMTHREWIEQMIFDQMTMEAQQEASMDRQLAADHAALMQRVRSR